jgi:hypothetical protein
VKISESRHTRQSVPLNLSMLPFCHG